MTKKLFAAASLLGTALLLTACNAPSNPRKDGSYAAVRHARTGSNIPQPDSADNFNSVGGASDMDRAGSTQSISSMRGMRGGGG